LYTATYQEYKSSTNRQHITILIKDSNMSDSGVEIEAFYEFKIIDEDKPISLLLCRYPLGSNPFNPNFVLIHSRKSKNQEPFYKRITAIVDKSAVTIDRPKRADAQTFWFDTSRGKKSLLAQLEKEGILKRTGQVFKQGSTELIAVSPNISNILEVVN